MPNRLYTVSNHRCGQPELDIIYSIDLQHRSGKQKTKKQVDICGLFSVQNFYDTKYCPYILFCETAAVYRPGKGSCYRKRLPVV